MKIIGITGGIGSGKTTVASAFKKRNVPVYIADERSKFLLSNDTSVITEVKNLLGKEAYHLVDNIFVPNRAFIASKVFNDRDLLDSLNGILHPAVRLDFDNFCLTHSTVPYLLYEAAILFETGGDKRCDATLLVAAAKEERITRVVKRDQVSREEVLARMSHQWSQERKLALADFVIINDNRDKIDFFVNYFHLFMLNN